MKKIALLSFTTIILWAAGTLCVNAQVLPPSFMLGEDESAYEKLCEAHPRTLIGVSNNDIDAALKNWLTLVQGIDTYAKSINLNIDGLRVWLHVFWKADGTIDHIGFFIMPNSRFIKPCIRWCNK